MAAQSNPYDPPHSQSTIVPVRQNGHGKWETLRLYYNLVAICCIAFATGPGQPGLLNLARFWQSSFLVLCAMNLVYTLGHVAELVVISRRDEQRSARRVLFGFFCCVALLIAMAAVAAEMYPGI